MMQIRIGEKDVPKISAEKADKGQTNNLQQAKHWVRSEFPWDNKTFG